MGSKKGSTATAPKPVKARRPRGPFVSNIDFVKTYTQTILAGGNAQDVADKLGIKVGSVNSRASDLRRKGAKLPSPRGAREKFDLQAINEAIQSVNGQHS